MTDTKLRSLAKAASWRTTGTLDTFFLSWLVTGAPTVAASIAAAEVCTKLVIFWAHERIWNRITWGRIQ